MKFFVIFVCAVLFIESKAIDLSYLEQIIASSSKNTKKLADDANVLVQTNLMLNNFLKSVDDSLGTNIGRLMTVTGQYSIQITNFRSSTVEFIRTLSLRDIIGAAGLLTRVTTDLVDLNPLVSFSDVFTAISNLRSGVEQEYKAYMNEIHGLLESRKAIPCFNASIEEFRTSLILLAVNIDNIITAEERELERQVTILGDKLVKVQPALLAQISTNCGTNSSCAINYIKTNLDRISTNIKTWRDDAENSVVKSITVDIPMTVNKVISDAHIKIDPIKNKIKACVAASS